MQLSLFDFVSEATPVIALADLFEAYSQCRSNKRNTLNALAFEMDYEANLLKLCTEINDGRYQPGQSIAFIINKPVKREIFAADFRDRVVHHLIINKLNPLFEKFLSMTVMPVARARARISAYSALTGLYDNVLIITHRIVLC
jgi:hypothetical protein